MLGFSSPRALAPTLLLVVSTLGCGLRSDPFAPDDPLVSDDDDGSDPGDPNRPGTCNNPLPIPFMRATLSGELSGPSFNEGWCGSDGGPEDVYILTPGTDTNVTIALDGTQTDPELVPTLRVVEDGCAAGEGFTKICTRNLVDEPFFFFAQAGRAYSIIIDSRDGAEGRYGFHVDYDFPSTEQCNIHPEVIEQLSGSAFIWNNEFSQGQGRVDSRCGGPGRENMFRLRANYAGTAFAVVESSGGFAPLISFREDCSTLTELDCTTAPAGGTAQLSFFIPQAGDYFLVIDQAEIGSGSYQLRVDFE